MKRLNYTIQINAPKAKVWETLFNDATYREWTKIFSEGSYAVTDWKEGSKVQFLSGDGHGMYSRIEKVVPDEIMEIKHLGEIKDGEEQPSGPETHTWYGAMENYHLSGNGNATELTVELDNEENYDEYFRNTYPKALEKVKEIAER
ncbi:SRPBCC domain-containing protein [Adhaeribacter soli]|uniref:SRPBCC domain-containing protein n=1 Tax=Adhaeribacter soli TaxID=2607655 RepID=A0A5N1IM04_9BACT|nr:SRPBCC domain-containing protein [Adhaeribacter soli]KAA9324937.1 SRPBCC domain-containing protein [Adhaeribacter soli]